MSDDNKEMIAKTALHLFAIRGYEGVGVQEICEAAQITKPTLYHYFKSKRGLLEHIVEVYGNILLSELQTALVYEHDFIKSLTKVLKAEIEFACENKEYFGFHCILLNAPEASEEKEVFSGLKNEIKKMYLEFFQQSCNEFGNMKDKEELFSLLFWNKVVSVAALCARGELTADDQTVYRIIHSTVYGIAN